MISTTLQNNSKNNKRIVILLTRAVSLVFWITVWYIAAEKINTKILLPSPVDVVNRLCQLVSESTFITSVSNSFSRILIGFFTALVAGVVLAVVSVFFKPFSVILAPFMSAMKSVPVASFVILSLIWLDTAQLSEFVAFVMVTPIIYINVVNGINSKDDKMLEMAKVFGFSPFKKLLFIYLPSTIPFFKSACSVALGLCWKAGIAAELIGTPEGTIGEQLYYSKIYILTEDLFAWTIVIILISILFEKLFMFTLDSLMKLYERV
jgi:NitT/TauT family transport system permease protein